MAEPDRTNADAERVSDIVAKWKLVPIEPTPGMLMAYHGALKGLIDSPEFAGARLRADGRVGGVHIGGNAKATARYCAMLAAVPKVEAADIIEAQSKALAEARVAAIDALRDLEIKFSPPDGVSIRQATVAEAQRLIGAALTPTPENPNG